MAFRRSNNSFVCLDEVTGQPERMNYIIYNPIKDAIPFRVELLYKTIKAGTGLELSSVDLIHLTKYEAHQLDTFVDELSWIIGIYKKNKKKK